MTFDPVTYAHEELVPMLRALCELTEADHEADQHRFFASALAGIERASQAEDLADPFMQLSTSAFMGFHFQAGTALLLDQLLEKAQRLAESLSLDASEIQ